MALSLVEQARQAELSGCVEVHMDKGAWRVLASRPILRTEGFMLVPDFDCLVRQKAGEAEPYNTLRLPSIAAMASAGAISTEAYFIQLVQPRRGKAKTTPPGAKATVATQQVHSYCSIFATVRKKKDKTLCNLDVSLPAVR